MNYKNSEMKIDQLVGYLNDEKINLSPAFQRGHVWSVRLRRKLLSNMLLGKPIPAVFLYKEASGAKYSYNILDGKQRIESVILFLSAPRSGTLEIRNWNRYFVDKQHRSQGGFWIEWDGKKKTFSEIPDEAVRDFREYSIPTVEIELDDETTLDEIISLFVDINQQGVPVQRFAVVKAMFKDDPLLKPVFNLIAIQQRRGDDIFYRMKRNDFTAALKKLPAVNSVKDNNSRVDRMWELLLEFALFAITKQHRKPVEILRGFISKKSAGLHRLERTTQDELRSVFDFLGRAAKRQELCASRFMTDQTHFYSLVTAILANSWLKDLGSERLVEKIVKIAAVLDGKRSTGLARPAREEMRRYIEVSRKQTTDVSKREDRQRMLEVAIAAA